MRTVPRWFWLLMAAVLGASALWVSLSVSMMWSTFSAQEQEALGEVLVARVPLLLLCMFFGWGLLAALVWRYIVPLSRSAHWLAEQVLLKLNAQTLGSPIPARPGLDPIISSINQLLEQRQSLRDHSTALVEASSRKLEQERSRLAALMAELQQSVVVCNAEGRVLLFNQRARMQFKALSTAPSLAGGAELLGLGRSIYSALDRRLIAHALENIQARLHKGAASPTAQFVTTSRSGQLLRVLVTPVKEGQSSAKPEASAEGSKLSGFMLMLDNVTRDFERDTQRDQLWLGLTDSSRAGLNTLKSQIEALAQAASSETHRAQVLASMQEVVSTLSEKMRDATTQANAGIQTRWPLENMLGSDFLQACERRLTATLCLKVSVTQPDQGLWLRLDSFSMLMAVHYLSARLQDEYGMKQVELRLAADSDELASIDLIWTGQALSTETAMSWEMDAMQLEGETQALSVREVVQRHGGRFWFERERVRHQAFFRFLLRVTSAEEEATDEGLSTQDSRPEFYDFDLFDHSPATRSLDDTPLSELAYTVFDTETTGLHPSAGDEIIQIGATRISGGKLRRAESFEQLIDPVRSIPEAGIPIHGITPEMVRGKPRIAAVLPAFHTFARETVLVAHNAAFDMRFLQLKQAMTGVVFDQPVLDTLLLSAVVHPNQESHRLEAITERFNIQVTNRHTALGDALVTAEVFLRLIPLLNAQGIVSLRQAREAAQATYFARLKY
ncbi:MAG: 3'-5' exonuclease [Ideonella sp.]|nr:3'-5' exonuclease [Ideonella sp.]